MEYIKGHKDVLSKFSTKMLYIKSLVKIVMHPMLDKLDNLKHELLNIRTIVEPVKTRRLIRLLSIG